MKKLKLFFLYLFAIFFISVICYTIFIDKEKLARFISDEISNKIDKEVSFDNDLKISIFPSPRIIINNLEIKDESQFVLFSKKVKIFSDWASLLSQEPKLNKLELFDPKLNFFKKGIKKKARLNLIKVKLNNTETRTQIEKFLSWIHVLKVSNGTIEIGNEEKYKIRDLDFNFQNGTEKVLEGSLFYENLKSDIKYKLLSEDFQKIKINLFHSFKIDKENVLFFDGVIKNTVHNILIEGKISGENLNFENLKFNKIVTNKSKQNVHNVGFPDKKKVLLDIETNLSKVIFNEKKLSDVKFKIKFFNQNILLENFNALYYNSEINLDSKYSINNEKLSGLLFIRNFVIPEKTFNIKKYDIFGGVGNTSIKFESILKLKALSELLNNINLNGKVLIKNLNIVGLDIKKVIQKIDSVKSLPDLLNLFGNIGSSGSSRIDIVEGDFKVNSGILIIDDLVSKNKNLTIKTSGEYNLKSEKFSLDNKINLKTDSYPNLPSFSIRLSGKPEKFSTKYNFDEIKKTFLNESLLRFNAKEILKIPLKNGKEIDLKNIIEMFSN